MGGLLRCRDIVAGMQVTADVRLERFSLDCNRRDVFRQPVDGVHYVLAHQSQQCTRILLRTGRRADRY
jgi:hypothetical protein